MNKKPIPSKRKPQLKNQPDGFRYQNDSEIVYRVWDELDQFSPSDGDEALRHFALKLKRLFKADNIKWIGAVRVLKGQEARKDPMKGWRLRTGFDLVPDTKEYTRLVATVYQREGQVDPRFEIGMTNEAQIKEAGKFRVHRLRDGWIPFREFSKTKHYLLHYRELGIRDRMWICFPLNAETESIFLIDRTSSRRHFTQQEAQLAGDIMRGIRGFHRRLFLDRGLLSGEQPLSPVLQRIIQKLLTGMSEKEIALSMGQNLATTHKYIQTIYARFGANGRASLMSLWLGT